MNHESQHRSILSYVPAVVLLCCFAIPFSADALDLSEIAVVVPPDDFGDLTEDQRTRLARMLANPQISQLTVWRLNLADVIAAGHLGFDLLPQSHLTLERRAEGLRRLGDHRWVFRDVPGRRFALLVVRDLRMTGVVKLAGQETIVFPVGDELIAVATLTEPLRPIMAPAPCDFVGTTPPTDGLILCAPDASSTCWEFSVLVAYTPEAAEAAAEVSASGIEGDIRTFVDETNQTYAVSNVLQRMRLAGVHRIPYEQDPFREMQFLLDAGGDLRLGCMELLKADLGKIQQTDDGDMDEIHQLRDHMAADVVVYMAGYLLCSGGLACDVLAQAHTAFALVAYKIFSPLPEYTFAHEVGHLQGAGHEPELGPSEAYSPFAYGHGYRVPGPSSIGTIMCNGTDTRIGLWSNPNLTEPGGSAVGTESNNNSRVLNETACRVARFREPATIEVNPPALCLIGSSFGMVVSFVTVVVKSDDSPVPGALVVFESDNPAVADLLVTPLEVITDATGSVQAVVKGLSPGNTEIRITSLGATVTVPVRVQLPPVIPW